LKGSQLQKIAAGSRLTLPVTVLYGLVIWFISGVIQHQWWIQMACYVLATYLMILLNNFNALIRVYSRAITSAFIILSCVASFLFPSLEGGIVTVGFVASLLTIFATYQNREATGWIYYTFLILGLASVAKVHLLMLIPIYWILMIFLSSISLRTFIASLLGLLTPYWFWITAVLIVYKGNFGSFTSHFLPLTEVDFFYSYDSIPLSHYLTYAFLVILTITGIIHFLRTSYNDKIRTRQLYYSIMFFDIVVLILLPLFPQYDDLLLRPAIILTSPLIGHFIALTNTKITNIAFYIILITALLLTGFNLWTSSFTS
jgi:hypothetical protein